MTVSSVGGDGAPLDPPQEGRLVLFVDGEATTLRALHHVLRFVARKFDRNKVAKQRLAQFAVTGFVYNSYT